MRYIIYLFLFLLLSCTIHADEISNRDNKRYFIAVEKIDYNEEKAKLGKKLFFDKRLSEDGHTSCETCHNLYWDFSGTSRRVKEGLFDPISVINSGLNYMFFNDGSIKSIYDQVDRSISSIDELATTKERLISRISVIDEYVSGFARVYEDGLKYENVRDAFVEFEKAITSVNSAFDKYLLGDNEALSKEQKDGFRLFKEIGCVACHNGANLGSNIRQLVDFYSFIIKDSSSSEENKNITKENIKKYFLEDSMDFEHEIFSCGKKGVNNTHKLQLDFMRVPPLRNIARTGPYFRCGKVTSLQQIIKNISLMQLDYVLSDSEVDLLYKFLLSLNGEIPRIMR